MSPCNSSVKLKSNLAFTEKNSQNNKNSEMVKEYMMGLVASSPQKKQGFHFGQPVQSPNKRLVKGSWSSSGNIFKSGISPKKNSGPKQIRSHKSSQMLFKPPVADDW